MITRQHAHELRALIEKTSATLTDEEALTGIELFPRWSKSAEYEVNDRVSYNGLLYKCLMSHIAQASWTPADAPSLWVRVDDPSIEFPEWIQPTGATDAYPFGAKVSHNDKHWVSTIDANVYEPPLFWEEVV